MQERFRIYRNLHHKNWTVQAHNGKGWRKLVGLTALWVPGDVEFIIYTTGRDRVRAEGKKYVHAYAEVGVFQLTDVGYNYGLPFDISYNPYNDRGFTATEKEYDEASGGQDPLLHRHDNLAGTPSGGTLFATDGHIYSVGIVL